MDEPSGRPTLWMWLNADAALSRGQRLCAWLVSLPLGMLVGGLGFQLLLALGMTSWVPLVFGFVGFNVVFWRTVARLAEEDALAAEGVIDAA